MCRSSIILLLASLAVTSALAVSSENRTVIFIYFESIPDQDVFIRGGLDASTHTGCTEDAATDACAVPIRIHLLGTIEHYEKYNSWRVGDNHLDWHGPEVGQGDYFGAPASGTPLAWTTNNVLSPGYQELNSLGDNYWMVDMEMDCSRTEQGWFDIKGYVVNGGDWEGDIFQGACTGTIGGSAPYSTTNHIGQCGAINTFTFNSNECNIDAFTD